MPWNDIRFRIALFTAGFCSLTAAIYAVAGIEPSGLVVAMMVVAPPVSVILWMQKDASLTGTGAGQDVGWFVWMAWPVVIPWYVFKTRGRRGWLLLTALIALMLAPQVVAPVLYALFPGASF